VKKAIAVVLLAALTFSLAGCQTVPQQVIQVHDAQFKYRGSLVWLYEGADGQVHMLRGNYRPLTAYTVAESRFNPFKKGTYLTGKGEWEEITNVRQDQLIYVREADLAANQQKEVLARPDYVLAVNLERLRNKIPQVKNAAELELLRAAFAASLESDNNPIATITMANGERIQLELYPDIAPNTVNNFISLAQQGFYDGLTFHRVVPDFIIQGGDPQGNGTGGPGYSIKGEFAANGFSNSLSHTKGVISMARTPADPDSAGSQFFIMVADAPQLDGQYAAFGKVISGQEVADRISRVPNDGTDLSLALEPPRILSIIVETFDVTYPAPRTIAR